MRFGAGAGDAAAAAHLMGVLIIQGIILGFGAPESANSIILLTSGIILGSELEKQTKRKNGGRAKGFRPRMIFAHPIILGQTRMIILGHFGT